MTDLEITRLCAQAMGWHTGRSASKVVAYNVNECAIIAGNDSGGESVYDPLHDDAQAMALVKRFRLDINSQGSIFPDGIGWNVRCPKRKKNFSVTRVWEESADLNRVICSYIAHMQAAK